MFFWEVCYSTDDGCGQDLFLGSFSLELGLVGSELFVVWIDGTAERWETARLLILTVLVREGFLPLRFTMEKGGQKMTILDVRFLKALRLRLVVERNKKPRHK